MNNYVKLPKIQEIQVENFVIYKKGKLFRWEIKDDLNYVLGGNGLGKTTLINIIQFSLTGNDQISKQLRKINSEAKKNDNQNNWSRIGDPKITVTFSIGNMTYLVSRVLSKNDYITSFEITDQKDRVITDSKETDLDQIYLNHILEHTGLESLSDLDFLFEKLLFRKEESESLIWNSDEQIKVLQLLLNPIGYYTNYENLKQKYDNLYNEQKHLVDDRSKVRKEIKKIDEEIQKIEPQSSTISEASSAEIDELSKQHTILIEKVDKAKRLNTQLLESLNKENGTLQALYKQEEELMGNLDAVEEHDVYDEEHIHYYVYEKKLNSLMILDKLINHRVCAYCDQRVSHNISDRFEKLIHDHECVFCNQSLPSSKLPPAAIRPKQRSIATNAIQKIEQSLTEVRKSIDSTLKNVRRMNKESEEFRYEIRNIEKSISEIETKITEKDSNAMKQSEATRRIKDYLRDIDALKNREKSFDEQIPIKTKEMNHAKSALDEFSEQNHLQKVRDSQGVISIKFDKYADAMIGMKSELVPTKAMSSLNKRYEFDIYMPIIDGIPREGSNDLSKSQAILVDYSFRMAFLDFYCELTHQDITVIFETSEGVLDLSYITRFGKELSNFGKDHNLILISNVSRSDFLESVFSNIKDKNDRLAKTLNFFKVGRLTKVQELGRGDYDAVWKDVFGQVIQWV